MHLFGQSVPQDYQEAKTLFEESADQENANAQFMLGWIYQDGLGVKEDQQAGREVAPARSRAEFRPRSVRARPHVRQGPGRVAEL